MKRKTIIILFLSITMVATAAYAARSLGKEKEQTSETTDDDLKGHNEETLEVAFGKPVVVKTMQVETTNLIETVKATGITAPVREVTFSAEIPGKVEYVGADIGEKVRKGQVLARVNFVTLQAERSRADSAYTLARTTYQRLQSLGEDIVTRQKLDESFATMVAARAGLDIAENDVKKSVIRSTIRGVVTSKHTERGEFATPGAPLFHVVDYSTVVVEAQMPETVVSSIKKGTEAMVLVDALGETFKGSVDTILPLADTASKTFTVRVELDNADLRILVGMSAAMTLKTRVHENVVVVPQDIVIESNEGRSVFVASGNTAERRTVILGPTEDDRVVIVSGIEPGEQIVVLGHRNLEHGQPITIAK